MGLRRNIAEELTSKIEFDEQVLLIGRPTWELCNGKRGRLSSKPRKDSTEEKQSLKHFSFMHSRLDDAGRRMPNNPNIRTAEGDYELWTQMGGYPCFVETLR